MQTITGGGAFTAGNINAINANFADLQTVNVWVRPQAGNNTGNGSTQPLGSYSNPYATMGGLAGLMRPGLVVGFEGVLFEQVTFPIVNNVTIIGVPAVPRQATTSNVPNGGGATWMSPLSGISNTTALATVQGQAWVFQNIFFNNAATSAGCVKLAVAGDPPLAADASQCSFINCTFTGANLGIDDAGGSFDTLIDGCKFFLFGGVGDVAIKSTSTAVRLPRYWRILNSRFMENVNHIVAPAERWEITNCMFDAATTVNINFTGGTAPNFVQRNSFSITAANFDPTGGVTGVSGDAWSNNLIDAIETGLPTD